MATYKHPNDMTAEELRELVGAMSWLALDLGQHLHFTNTMLRGDRAAAYEQAAAMAYEISALPYDGPTLERKNPAGLTVLGANGLEL